MSVAETQAASAAPRRKLSVRRATIETRAPLTSPNGLKRGSHSFSELADIFGAEAREQWLQPMQVRLHKVPLSFALSWSPAVPSGMSFVFSVRRVRLPVAELDVKVGGCTGADLTGYSEQRFTMADLRRVHLLPSYHCNGMGFVPDLRCCTMRSVLG